jgi:HPt (histidine-containing phosphotransfer) domain-containing protein
MVQQDGTRFNSDCPVDWADLFGRIDNEAIISEFAVSFLKNSQTLILSLKSAVNSHSPDQIELYAHALKGSASNMGAVNLAKKAWIIEKAAAEKHLADIQDMLNVCEEEYFALRTLLERPDWMAQAKRAAEVKST